MVVYDCQLSARGVMQCLDDNCTYTDASDTSITGYLDGDCPAGCRVVHDCEGRVYRCARRRRLAHATVPEEYSCGEEGVESL